MNKQEITEIRRRLDPEKNNITRIEGCYVNQKKQIVSTFGKSYMAYSLPDAELYLSLFKKVLSGTSGANLIDIAFSSGQLMDDEAHGRLMALRESALTDADALSALYQAVIDAYECGDSYLILVMNETYDVPYRAKDGERMDDMADEVFNYVLACVCPVKQAKSALFYDTGDGEFHGRGAEYTVSAPDVGFLFPAFDDRAANISGALFYTRDTAVDRSALADALFRTELPMPAEEQKETFQTILEESLDDEMDLSVAQSVHETFSGLIETHAKEKQAEPLKLTKNEMSAILGEMGVSDEKRAVFEEKFTEQLGETAELRPQNIVKPNRFEVTTPDVVIRVTPDKRDLVETRVIDGFPYILIRADEDVTVNGVHIRI